MSNLVAYKKICTLKREEVQTDSNHFKLDYFPINVKILACFVNNEGSFMVHIIAHDFKKSYNRNSFHGEHMQQESHQSAQNVMHQNFKFFQL